MNENKIERQQHQNPFFAPYDTPHNTVPFDKITTADYEEAFMEGIKREDEEIDAIINNPKSLLSTTRLYTSMKARANITTICSAECRRHSLAC